MREMCVYERARKNNCEIIEKPTLFTCMEREL